MLSVLNGVPTGTSVTAPGPNNLNQWASMGMMAGNQIFNQPTTTGGWNAAETGFSNPMDGWWMG
jgi:hypothetical protein